MSKTLSIFAIASALLFGAVPGHAALFPNAITENALDTNGIVANGIVANGFDNNGLDWNGFDYNGFDNNGMSVNGPQEAASPRMTIIAVELPKAQ